LSNICSSGDGWLTPRTDQNMVAERGPCTRPGGGAPPGSLTDEGKLAAPPRSLSLSLSRPLLTLPAAK